MSSLHGTNIFLNSQELRVASLIRNLENIFEKCASLGKADILFSTRTKYKKNKKKERN